MKDKLVERARFLANGQDDPHSVTIDELCDRIEEQEAAVKGLVEELAKLEAVNQRLCSAARQALASYRKATSKQ